MYYITGRSRVLLEPGQETCLPNVGIEDGAFSSLTSWCHGEL